MHTDLMKFFLSVVSVDLCACLLLPLWHLAWVEGQWWKKLHNVTLLCTGGFWRSCINGRMNTDSPQLNWGCSERVLRRTLMKAGLCVSHHLSQIYRLWSTFKTLRSVLGSNELTDVLRRAALYRQMIFKPAPPSSLFCHFLLNCSLYITPSRWGKLLRGKDNWLWRLIHNVGRRLNDPLGSNNKAHAWYNTG